MALIRWGSRTFLLRGHSIVKFKTDTIQVPEGSQMTPQVIQTESYMFIFASKMPYFQKITAAAAFSSNHINAIITDRRHKRKLASLIAARYIIREAIWIFLTYHGTVRLVYAFNGITKYGRRKWTWLRVYTTGQKLAITCWFSSRSHHMARSFRFNKLKYLITRENYLNSLV